MQHSLQFIVLALTLAVHKKGGLIFNSILNLNSRQSAVGIHRNIALGKISKQKINKIKLCQNMQILLCYTTSYNDSKFGGKKL